MYKTIKQNMTLNFYLPKIMIFMAVIVIVGKIVKNILGIPVGLSTYISLTAENLYGFESAILAFFIPIGLFLFDSRSNKSATSVNWDNTVIIDKVIKAKVIFPVILLISTVPFFENLSTTTVVVLSLLLYAYIFDSIQSSYYWMIDGNNPEANYRTDKRIEYLLDLKDDERTYEVLKYIIRGNDWHWITEQKLIDIILKKIKIFLYKSNNEWSAFEKLIDLWDSLFHYEGKDSFRFKNVATIEFTLHWLELEYDVSEKKQDDDLKATIVAMYRDVYNYAASDERENFNRFIRSYFVDFIDDHKQNRENVESYIGQVFDPVMLGLYTGIQNEKYDRFSFDKRGVDCLITSENIRNGNYISKSVANIISEHINKSTYHILTVADIDEEEKYDEVVQIISDLMPNIDHKLYIELLFLDSFLVAVDEQPIEKDIEEALVKILKLKYFKAPSYEPKHRSYVRYQDKNINITKETIDAFKFVTGMSNDIYYSQGELTSKLNDLKELLNKLDSDTFHSGTQEEIQKFDYNMKFLNRLIDILR